MVCQMDFLVFFGHKKYFSAKMTQKDDTIDARI
jgi:hypothetical protein